MQNSSQVEQVGAERKEDEARLKAQEERNRHQALNEEAAKFQAIREEAEEAEKASEATEGAKTGPVG